MDDMAWLLYVVAAAIVFVFWREVRGMSFDALLQRSAREHELVGRVFTRHPLGGSWSEYKSWTGQRND